MAVPTDPSQWTVRPDYDATSQQYACSTCGMPHRSGEPVFRGNLIEFEGFYDVCIDCARTLATHIGWIDPATLTVTPDEELELEMSRLRAENAALNELVDHLREVFAA